MSTRPLTLHAFPGGMELPGLRTPTIDAPVRTLPVPSRLFLPLDSQVGLPAHPIVSVGELVQRGQCLARAGGYVGAPLHAPVSGTICAVDARVGRPGGRTSPAIVVAPDVDDARPVGQRPAEDPLSLPVDTLLERIADAGIVGLGGAGFPAAVKLAEGRTAPVRLLVINAVECEPGLTCDQRLVREHAEEVLLGAAVLARITAAEQCVIAVAEDRVAAYTALQGALSARQAAYASGDILPLLVRVPCRYPTGAERQLIQVLTGIELRPDEVPIHHGVVVQNVATTAAIAWATASGLPLLERYVTVLGAVPSPGNFRVLIGTPVSGLLAAAGLESRASVRIRFGGPLTGQYVSDPDAPIDKRTAAVTVESTASVPPERDCIRCGACIPVCPSRLHPPALLERLRNRDFDVALDFDLFACIECGLCDHVCPSRIPLSDRFRHGKRDVEAQHRAQQQTDRFRQMVAERPAHRERREALLDAHRASRRARPPSSDDMAAPSTPALTTGASSGGLRGDIAAAVARVRARRQPVAQTDGEGEE